jgi:geranylgeranyl pyrophosphate synthase
METFYEAIKQYLMEYVPGAGKMGAVWLETAGRAPEHWRLPAEICLAVGGERQAALAVSASLACLYTGIILVDDLLDGDGRAESLGLSPGEAANLAQGFYALGLRVLAALPLPSETRAALSGAYSEAGLGTCLGQELDALNPQDEGAYWAMVRAKSSPFFAFAFYSGALAGGLGLEEAYAFYPLGEVYGELIQIHDDLEDAFHQPASRDWGGERANLALLFARTVRCPERERFLALYPEAPRSPAALREAQSLLVRCGAFSYGLYQLQQRHQAARQLAKGLVLREPARLERLLGRLVQPVERLLGRV